MKNKNTFLIALILVIVAATSIFVFAGGIKGKTAYQIAVEHGYRGTETEWLLSLQGKDGSNAAVDYYQLYEQSKESGEISTDTTFLQFIQTYISSSSSTEKQMLQSIQDSLMSSVNVITMYSQGSATGTSAGAGFVYDIDNDGNMLVVTNFHVTYVKGLYSNVRYYITLYSDNYIYSESGVQDAVQNKGIQAEYVGGDKEHDIAVLKVTNNQRVKDAHHNGDEKCVLKKVTFADISKDLAVGTSCYTIGNPMGEGMSVSQGIVSIAYEQIFIEDVTNDLATIELRGVRVTCNINGGNSGGALYDLSGQVIGVINSKREYAKSSDSSSEDIDGVSFAIALPVAKNAIEEIIRQNDAYNRKTPQYVSLGLEYATASTSVEYESGVVKVSEITYIKNIAFSSIFQNKLQINDIIDRFVVIRGGETIADQTINHYYTLSDYEMKLQSGDRLTIYYERTFAGVLVPGTVTVTIG